MRTPIPDLIGPPAESWAKTVHAVDADAAGDGSALQGDWLDRGALYDLAAGALVVVFDKAPGGAAIVTLHQVPDAEDAQLTELRTWTGSAGIIDSQVLADISGRVAALKPPGNRPVMLSSGPARPNTRAEDCHLCRLEVPAGEGRLMQVEGRTRVRHTTCPPRPPLRNHYEQACGNCRHPVPVGRGILYRTRGQYGTWLVKHDDGQCRDTPVPAAPAAPGDARPGVCVECLQEVPFGNGEVHGAGGYWRVTHGEACPPHPLNPDCAPTWRILAGDSPRIPDLPAGPAAGEAARVKVFLGMDELRPTDAIGYEAREFHGYATVSFIAVGLATQSRGDYDPDDEIWYEIHESIVRAATPDEAAPVLEREAATAARRRALTERTESLLQTWRRPRREGPDDYRDPTREEWADVSLTSLPKIPLPPGLGPSMPYEPSAYLDEPNGLIWTLSHNGVEGDHRASDPGRVWIPRSHPLTPERRRLIADLLAEYGRPYPW
ncbi:hypothetical protein [Nonomuraea sp. NPDC050643]|uniref:hypothetical protein n=1 Tax=Nonomuraea sp. NPDC050643 TaxID=3155660 RepID=UPI0033C8E83D